MIYILLVIGTLLLALVTFAMANTAYEYDEAHEKIFQHELEKLERSKRLMEEAETNPEYIERKKDEIQI